MKRMRPLCLALALLLLLPCLGARAAGTDEERPEVLRVGFFAFSGYHAIDEDGRRRRR